MSIFINGARYAVSTQLAAAAAITAITNASPAVASAVAPPSAGSVVVLASGWSALNDVVARAANPTANSFAIEGVDTTNANLYPAGEGAGAFRVASAFVGLSQVRDVDRSGGEQQFFTYQNVEDASFQQRQDPTYKNPLSMKFMLAYAPEQPWYQTLIDIDRKREPVVLREILSNGDTIYRYGVLTFNKEPTGKLNEHLQVEATFSMRSDSMRYDATP